MLYNTVLSNKIDDAMRKTLYERSEREKKVKMLLNTTEKVKQKRNFLLNMRHQRILSQSNTPIT